MEAATVSSDPALVEVSAEVLAVLQKDIPSSSEESSALQEEPAALE